MFEFPVGSRMRIVKGRRFPDKAYWAFYSKVYKFYYWLGSFSSSWVTPWLAYFFFLSSSTTFSINPFTVVIWGFYVFTILKSSSSILMIAFSEWTTSLKLSSACRSLYKISIPKSFFFSTKSTYELLNPQSLHLNSKRMTSLKFSILVKV